MALRDPGPVLSEHVGVVAAPVGRVRPVVLAVTTGEFRGADVPLVLGGHADRQVLVTGGPDVFSAIVVGIPLTIEVDHDGGWVQARGQWWWCGRFQVEEGTSGDTVVRQRTFNCASGVGAKLVPFTVGRGHRRDGEKALRRLLKDLSERLDCETWMLPDR
ncbi:hypothetical protein HC031_31590 [Planosporangium thailandense]|uniref:Uncharacterized protein n=1 Tax=Planosporangium thailandense TaxID=765197 RepID=A0ABX0Y866_9ACTN|nr:hypothetical protein [Planosporangium thailandense]NJC74223.1 hypothetical protein [Planosporangium thailandense]